eukprot:Skav208607  [mRNA]  locus=scaffold598:448880:449437:- [translate_table: standard]
MHLLGSVITLSHTYRSNRFENAGVATYVLELLQTSHTFGTSWLFGASYFAVPDAASDEKSMEAIIEMLLNDKGLIGAASGFAPVVAAVLALHAGNWYARGKGFEGADQATGKLATKIYRARDQMRLQYPPGLVDPDAIMNSHIKLMEYHALGHMSLQSRILLRGMLRTSERYLVADIVNQIMGGE